MYLVVELRVFTRQRVLQQIQQTTGRHLSKTLTSSDAAAIYNHCAPIICDDADGMTKTASNLHVKAPSKQCRFMAQQFDYVMNRFIAYINIDHY